MYRSVGLKVVARYRTSSWMSLMEITQIIDGSSVPIAGCSAPFFVPANPAGQRIKDEYVEITVHHIASTISSMMD